MALHTARGHLTGGDEVAPLVIGISGPSASGKSSVAEAVRAAHGDALIVQQDWYFRSPSECPADANFCDLRWLHTDEFVAAVEALAQGAGAHVPVIDFATFERTGVTWLEPQALIIVEGMTIFRMQELAHVFHAKFYLDLDLDVVATRKRERDREIRNKPADVVESQLQWIADEHARDTVIRRRADVTVLLGTEGIDSLAETVVQQLGAALRRTSVSRPPSDETVLAERVAES